MSKLDHILHLEDLIFYMKPRALLRLIDTLLDDLNTRTELTTLKIDGSPSLIIGVDPKDGKFYVATKSLFNKKPILYKSLDDLFTIKSDGLSWVMHLAYDRYKPDAHLLPIGLQGDVLWTLGHVDERKEGTFVGENVLKYRVDDYYLHNFDLKDIGVMWHTLYEGESLDTMKVTNKNVCDTEFLNDLRPDAETTDFYPGFVHDMPGDAILEPYSAFAAKVVYHEGFQWLTNDQAERCKKHFAHSSSFEEYRQHVHDQYVKLAEGYKTQAKRVQVNHMLQLIERQDNAQASRIKLGLEFYQLLVELKHAILDQYASGEQSVLQPHTYDVATDSYARAPHEGLVFRDDLTVKLVNRDGFTKLNKSSPYSKQSRSNK